MDSCVRVDLPFRMSFAIGNDFAYILTQTPQRETSDPGNQAYKSTICDSYLFHAPTLRADNKVKGSFHSVLGNILKCISAQ